MINWKGKQIPFVYVFFYKIMKEHASNNLFISYADVRNIFRRRIHNVPHTYHTIILEEMEELQIIKKVGTGRRNLRYQFIGKDLDKKLNKYNEVLFT